MGLVKPILMALACVLAGCDVRLLCLPCVTGETDAPVDTEPSDTVHTDLPVPACAVDLSNVPVLTTAEACYHLDLGTGTVLGLGSVADPSEDFHPRLLVSGRIADDNQCEDGCLSLYEVAGPLTAPRVFPGLYTYTPPSGRLTPGIMPHTCFESSMRVTVGGEPSRVFQFEPDNIVPSSASITMNTFTASASRGAPSVLALGDDQLPGNPGLVIGDPGSLSGHGAVWCAPACEFDLGLVYDQAQPAVFGRAEDPAIGRTLLAADLLGDDSHEVATLASTGTVLIGGTTQGTMCNRDAPDPTARLWLHPPAPAAAINALPQLRSQQAPDGTQSDLLIGLPTLGQVHRLPRAGLPAAWSDQDLHTEDLDPGVICDPVEGGSFGSALTAISLENSGPLGHLLVGDPGDGEVYLYLEGTTGLERAPDLILRGDAEGFGKQIAFTLDFHGGGRPDLAIASESEVFVFCGEDVAGALGL
jgi:hypothetical protein